MAFNYRLDTTGEMDVLNLLLGLAWLGEASTEQIERLWLPTGSMQSSCLILTELEAEGYVTRRLLPPPIAEGAPSASARQLQGEDEDSDSDAQEPLPQPQAVLWSLTEQACRRLEHDDQYPPRYVPPRALRVARHDLMSTELIVRMVELGRAASLSGLYVEREARLDPEKARPIMDALIMVTLGGEYPHSHCVPWTRDGALPSERRVRYALENDRNSEPLGVIAGKAVAYAQAGTAVWTERYGKFPTPLWLLPSETRLQAVLRVWRETWPIGRWLMTIDAWLEGDFWIEYDDGTITERGLFRKTPTRLPIQEGA